MKKIFTVLSMIFILLLAGCKHEHSWVAAECMNPKTCKECGKTEGDVLGHSWGDATCLDPAICDICKETKGKALGHAWQDATCTEPRICSVCQITEGKKLGHTWVDATCTSPIICSGCQMTDGKALGHTWREATCTEPKTCSVCNQTEGVSNGHKTEDWKTTVEVSCGVDGVETGVCTVCQEVVERKIAKTEKHRFQEKIITEATYYNAGYKCVQCSVCNETDGEGSVYYLWDKAFVREFSSYSLFYLFDVDTKKVFYFGTNDTFIDEGTYRGSFNAGVTITWKHGEWKEKFIHYAGSNDATMIDGYGDEWEYKVCSIEKAQGYLEKMSS